MKCDHRPGIQRFITTFSAERGCLDAMRRLKGKRRSVHDMALVLRTECVRMSELLRLDALSASYTPNESVISLRKMARRRMALLAIQGFMSSFSMEFERNPFSKKEKVLPDNAPAVVKTPNDK